VARVSGPPGPLERRLLLLLVGGGALVTLGFAAWSAAADWEAAKTAGWPTAPGTVLERRTHMATPRTGKESPHYRVLVRYRYAVDGREYEADRFNPFDGWTDKAAADDALARYQPGAACEVSFDPADPSAAYLARGPRRGAWLLAGALAAAGVILLALAGWAVRRWRSVARAG